MTTVVFPGLGLSFELSRVAVTVFGRPIYWYGLIIACGLLLAACYCSQKAKLFGIKPDNLIDFLLVVVPASILGARVYYIIFYYELFRTVNGGPDFDQMVRIWDGGLAIYGGILAAVATTWVFTRVKGYSFAAWADMGVMGLLIGQSVGRWGNFVNGEAFGGPTDLPWRMDVYRQTAGGLVQDLGVHPTFLYESLWNLLGLLLLIFLLTKGARQFDGMFFALYVAWYGFGRTWIEGLRSDSLYLFDATLFGVPVRVSQALGLGSALAAVGFLVVHLAVKRHTPEELYVNYSTENVPKEET